MRLGMLGVGAVGIAFDRRLIMEGLPGLLAILLNSRGSLKWSNRSSALSDPEIAKRVQRKASYRQVAYPEHGFIWIFATAFSSRSNSIRSLSRTLRQPCEWDEKRQLVAVIGEATRKGVA